MKIKKLVLVGYLRLNLRLIDRIEYTPKEKTQVILGSNGSGKSSLMKELSPLPGVPSEFRKGGSKEIWIEHRGKEYYLLSSFTEDGNIFEFYCDGVNLNPGRTVTVFKELAKEHFNYTFELHNLVIGRVLFHELSVAERRKLFMALDNTDFSYAFAYFNRLKEKARDLQGTITQLQKRLSSETEGLLTPEQEIAIKRDSESLRGILESLLMAKNVGMVNPSQLEKDRDAVYGQWQMIFDQITATIAEYEATGTRIPLTELEAMNADAKQKLGECRNELTIRYEQHSKLEKELKEIQLSGSVDIKALEEDIAYLEKERAAAKESITIDLPWEVKDSPQAMLDAITQTANLLQPICDQLLEYSGFDYLFNDFQSGLEKANYDLAMHRDFLNKDRSAAEYAKHALENLEKNRNNDLTDCPKCGHRWNLLFSQAEYDRQTALLKNAEESFKSREQFIEYLTKKIETYQGYSRLRSMILHYIRNAPAAESFWIYLEKEGVFSRRSDRLSHELNRAMSYLNALVSIERCSVQLAEKVKLKGFYDAAKGKDKAKIEEGFKELEAITQNLHTKIRTLTDFVNSSNSEITVLKEIDMLACQLRTLEVELKNHSDEVIAGYCDAGIGDLINALKVDIIQKERMVAQVSMKKAVIENTEKAIITYKNELTLVNLAIDALSPKTGLIAHGMTQSINQFIDRVNRFIEKVWSYPLTINLIRPDDDDELDLDYKFTVNVNNTGGTPDIANTSSGMREIIHLACVITYMRSLGFEDYPVFLDEFAVKMDDAHRKAAYAIIEYLIDEADVSQVFLISHYENGYSSLSASDITVLCDANIVMPGHLTYNTCAIIN